MSDSNALEEEIALQVAVTTTDDLVQIDIGYDEIAVAVAFPNTGQVDLEAIQSLLAIAPSIIPQALEALEAQQ